jgi:hypothetical protein
MLLLRPSGQCRIGLKLFCTKYTACIMRHMKLSDCRTTAIGLFFPLSDYRNIEYRNGEHQSIGLSDIGLTKNYRLPSSGKLDAQTLLKGESYIFSLLLSYAGSGTKAHTGNPKTNTVFLTSFEIQIKKLEFHRACHSALMRTSFRVGFSFNHTYLYCDRMRWIKYILCNWVITQLRKYINLQRVSAEARKWEEKSSRYKYCTQRSREPLLDFCCCICLGFLWFCSVTPHWERTIVRRTVHHRCCSVKKTQPDCWAENRTQGLLCGRQT